MKNFKAIYDVCIPNEMLRLLYDVNESITKAESLIIIDIIQRGGLNHETPISHKQIVADCNISEKSAQRALKHLTELGLISYEHGNGFHAPSMLSIEDTERVPFTQIPASAIAELMSNHLTQTAIRLLLFVWRYTYGFKGANGCVKSCKLSDSFINVGTNIDKKNAQRAVRELKQNGAINTFIHNGSRIAYPCDVWVSFKPSTPVNLPPPPPVKMTTRKPVKMTTLRVDKFTP